MSGRIESEIKARRLLVTGPGCGRLLRSRHAGCYARTGHPMKRGYSIRTQAEALAARLEVRGPDDCWPWTGQIMKNGYGRLYGDRAHEYVHVVAWQLATGRERPPGYEIDHVCHTTDCRRTDRDCIHRRCGNPRHLKLATHRDNTNRTNSPSALNRRRTHCIHGHVFDQANTYIDRTQRRRCRACNRKAAREAYTPLPLPRPPRKPKPLKTHCLRGHPLSGENIYVNPRGFRICKTCRLDHFRAYRERKKAAS